MTSMKPLLPAALLGQSLNNFYARYEDDTEKANDKKAAQLRNKVKALTLVVRWLCWHPFLCSVGTWTVEETTKFSERTCHHLWGRQVKHFVKTPSCRSCVPLLIPAGQRRCQRRWSLARMILGRRNPGSVLNSLSVNRSPLQVRLDSHLVMWI